MITKGLVRVVGFSMVMAAMALAQPKSTGAAGKANPAARQFHDLLEAEWEYGLKLSPVNASSLGDRRYNDKWEDISLGLSSVTTNTGRPRARS
jgi:hypothetical protein